MPLQVLSSVGSLKIVRTQVGDQGRAGRTPTLALMTRLCLPTGRGGLEVRGHGGRPTVPVGVCGCVRAGHRGTLPASALPEPHTFWGALGCPACPRAPDCGVGWCERASGQCHVSFWVTAAEALTEYDTITCQPIKQPWRGRGKDRGLDCPL